MQLYQFLQIATASQDWLSRLQLSEPRIQSTSASTADGKHGAGRTVQSELSNDVGTRHCRLQRRCVDEQPRTRVTLDPTSLMLTC